MTYRKVGLDDPAGNIGLLWRVRHGRGRLPSKLRCIPVPVLFQFQLINDGQLIIEIQSFRIAKFHRLDDVSGISSVIIIINICTSLSGGYGGAMTTLNLDHQPN